MTCAQFTALEEGLTSGARFGCHFNTIHAFHVTAQKQCSLEEAPQIASFLGREGLSVVLACVAIPVLGSSVQLLAEVLGVFLTHSVAWEALGAEQTWRFLCFSVCGAARREPWVRWLPVPVRMVGCSVENEMFLAS